MLTFAFASSGTDPAKAPRRDSSPSVKAVHAVDEAIGHHGQMNGSPRDVTADPPQGEKFRLKAIWISNSPLQSRPFFKASQLLGISHRSAANSSLKTIQC